MIHCILWQDSDTEHKTTRAYGSIRESPPAQCTRGLLDGLLLGSFNLAPPVLAAQQILVQVIA